MTLRWQTTRALNMDAALELPAFAEWRNAAFDERWVVDADEIDETPIAILRRNDFG